MNGSELMLLSHPNDVNGSAGRWNMTGERHAPAPPRSHPSPSQAHRLGAGCARHKSLSEPVFAMRFLQSGHRGTQPRPGRRWCRCVSPPGVARTATTSDRHFRYSRSQFRSWLSWFGVVLRLSQMATSPCTPPVKRPPNPNLHLNVKQVVLSFCGSFRLLAAPAGRDDSAGPLRLCFPLVSQPTRSQTR